MAALFVDAGGVYAGAPGVDIWGPERDARGYPGPFPVVAHPPCGAWSCLAALVEARWGHCRGDDGGCFAAALAAVRCWGGVIEHPAFSAAWPAHGLNKPPRGGGWVAADFVGGWTCYVEQGRYGHAARKGSYLYAHGVELVPLRFGLARAGARACVSWCSNRLTTTYTRRIAKREALATPAEFRDVLLSIARTAYDRRRGEVTNHLKGD